MEDVVDEDGMKSGMPLFLSDCAKATEKKEVRYR